MVKVIHFLKNRASECTGKLACLCRVQPIFNVVKACLFDWRLKRAIKKAQREADNKRKKFLVLVWQGRPVVVSMQGVRKLIKQHRFAKGFTAERARQLALFEANPKNQK